MTFYVDFGFKTILVTLNIVIILFSKNASIVKQKYINFSIKFSLCKDIHI